MRKLIFLLRKEFKQFIRNPFLPKMVVMFPLLVMLVIPWVMTMDVHHINVSVVDNDHSSFSRRFISKVSASDYFTLKSIHSHYDASLAELEDGKVDVIVEIGDGGNVNISSNGVNAIKGSFGMQYLSKVVSQTAGELSAESGRPVAQISVQTQNRYNPTLNYRYYMIPAVMIMLLIMLCGFLPALNLVGEKEIGTIEQINVTPVGKFTFTLAKLIPYWIMGIVVLSLAMLIASLLYGLTPVGSLWSIYLAAASVRVVHVRTRGDNCQLLQYYVTDNDADVFHCDGLCDDEWNLDTCGFYATLGSGGDIFPPSKIFGGYNESRIFERFFYP
jgi:ABC-2 type transport system permease protein